MKTIDQLCQAVEETGVECGRGSTEVYVHIYGNSEPAAIYSEPQFLRFCEYFLGDEELI